MNWFILLVALGNAVMGGEAKTEVPKMRFVPSNHSSESGKVNPSRQCTADELLPRSEDDINGSAVEWAIHDIVEPRYGCDCPFYRARWASGFLHERCSFHLLRTAFPALLLPCRGSMTWCPYDTVYMSRAIFNATGGKVIDFISITLSFKRMLRG